MQDEADSGSVAVDVSRMHASQAWYTPAEWFLPPLPDGTLAGTGQDSTEREKMVSQLCLSSVCMSLSLSLSVCTCQVCR